MDEQPQPSSSGVMFLLAATALCASAVGAFIYFEKSREKPVTALDKAGFDLAEVQRQQEAAGGGPAASGQKSGLGMINSISGMNFSQPGENPNNGGAAAQAPSAASISALVKATEQKIVALAMDYTNRHPIIRQYGQDWMSQPDLRKLNDDYMRDHDPFKFMSGLARAPSFGPLVRKYATQKPIRDFTMDAMRSAPAEAMPTAMEYVNKDKTLQTLTDTVASSLGLPPGILGSAMGGKVDGKQIAEKIGVQQQTPPATPR